MHIHNNLIKAVQKGILAVFAAILINQASAFNYHEGDLMLVFRKDGYRDVEFNLGTVSNFLNQASGTRGAVTNWNRSLVLSNFDDSLDGVLFTLSGETALTNALLRIWASSAELAPLTPVTDLPYSGWSPLRSTILSVGNAAAVMTATNQQSVYVIDSGSDTSYTSIVTSQGAFDPANMGGTAPFSVEAENPTSLLFYELKISSATPKPAARLVGWFCLDGTGVLYFTAGPLIPPPQPRITALNHSDMETTISFTCTNCVNYRLWLSTNVQASPYIVLPVSVAGDTNSSFKVLTDTSDLSDAANLFYKVEAYR